ncbi:hypothetical protein [Comamonas testosteroni]|uniref:hypothetical protein n=1 Tax=Comamonas testosteroni TaxID=285 RepID=UPI0015FAAC22|nr:hypothetical protein [Comamonas testosteroni]
MAIAANFRKYAEAMALQLVLPFGKPVWNGSRPTTKLGREIRAYITKAMKARGLVEYAAEKAIPQWWKDAQTRLRALTKFMREHQLNLDLVEQHQRIPEVGEMYEGKVMTVAKHRRLLILEIIKYEEASGDPELIKIAAWRRRGINA